MPKRTNTFQRIIRLINSTLVDEATVTESALLRDKITGENREIDILITKKVNPYTVHIGIEVISWNRPADTTWIERMYAKHAHLPVNKLILVSESGYTKPAIEKAKFYGIETITIEDAVTTDWPLLTKLEATGIFKMITVKFECTLVCRFDDHDKQLVKVSNATTISNDSITISLDSLVRRLTERKEFQDALFPHVTSGSAQDFWFSISEGGDLWSIAQNGQTGVVEELWVGLKILQTESPVQFSKGKYLDTPFIAGASTESIVPPQLQFVLALRQDGTVKGHLLNGSGVQLMQSSL